MGNARHGGQDFDPALRATLDISTNTVDRVLYFRSDTGSIRNYSITGDTSSGTAASFYVTCGTNSLTSLTIENCNCSGSNKGFFILGRSNSATALVGGITVNNCYAYDIGQSGFEVFFMVGRV